MRSILIILFAIVFKVVNAQLSIDIGNDTTFCKGLFLHEPDTAFIGSNLKIENGTEPYNFAWSCKVELSPTLIFYASTFLNDTTLENPYFIDSYGNDWIRFYLTVEDQFETITDSIDVRFSSFGYNLGYNIFEINKGDSIKLGSSGIGGGIPPLQYSWEPVESLSTHDSSVFASPDTTTEYFLSAIDDIGCLSDTMPFYKIIVNTNLSVVDKSENRKSFLIKRMAEDIIIENTNLFDKKLFIQIISVDGKVLLFDEFKYSSFIIPQYLIRQPILIVNIFSKNELIFSEKVLTQ